MLYFTAITLKLNTKPWNEGGVTSREIYTSQLNDICTHFKCNVSDVCGYELDKQCQLHIHTTLISKKMLHRKKICNYYRNLYKKYSIWLVPVSGLKNWEDYCLKAGNEEEKYHWLCRFYDNNTLEYNDEENIRAIVFSQSRFHLDDIILNFYDHWEKLEDSCQFID